MGINTMGIPQDITLALAQLHGAKVFVETGTFQGGTTRWAAGHFPAVHTIERAETLHRMHGAELAKLPGVTPHLGDSRDILPQITTAIGDAAIVFWLDGHWSGGLTAGQGDECPLLGELSCLAKRSNDIILIDDARLFLAAPPRPHDPRQWPTIAEILHALPGAGRQHFVQIMDDVIFIVPQREQLVNRLIEHAQRRAEAFWSEYSARSAPSPSLVRRVARRVKQLVHGKNR